MPRCAAKKGDGTPCERIVGSSQRFCYSHDAAFAEHRKRSASRAARSPAKDRSSREIRQIQRRLEDLYGAVLAGKVSRQVAAVANQICNSLLRSIELGHRVRERDELSRTWDELEELLEEAERRLVSRR
jgi:hypothetical protein